jgi:hypothetical protein
MGDLPTTNQEATVLMSQNMFDAIDPPGIWVTLAAPETGEHETRSLTMRVQERGRRSVSVMLEVSRYSPEDSCFRAVAIALRELETLQEPLKRDLLLEVLQRAVTAWVEPF